MAFNAIPSPWGFVAILLVAICSKFPGSYNRDGLAVPGKRSLTDPKQGVFQAIQNHLISSLQLSEAEMPKDVNHTRPSSELTKWTHEPKLRRDSKSWHGAALERTKTHRESPTWSEKPNMTKDLEDTLSQDGQERHEFVSFFMARRKEEGRRNKIFWVMFVIAWVLLLVIFAVLEKRKPQTKIGMKLVSNIRQEDLLLDKAFFDMRKELSAKPWRRNKTDFAAWDYKLPPFEKNQGSTTLWVAPATLGQFLPTILSGEGDRFQYMGYRLASLAALPSGTAVSPLRLAEAGFHYNPEASTSAVVCHECGVTYRLDSPSATILPPLLHHQRTSPNCSVARSLMEVYGSSLGVKPSGDATQPQRLHAVYECETGLQTDGPTDMTDSGETPRVSRTDSATRADVSEQRRTDMVPSQGFNGYTMALPSTSQDVQSYPGAMAVPSTNPGSSEKIHLDLNSAVYPLFGSLQSRLATFSKWPEASFRPPELLAPLGFFYAGYADCIRCFYCGIGLKTWEENDDPEEEHIRWRPNCQYVLATKGRRFVDRTLARLNQSGNNTDDAIDGQSSAARDTRSSASQRPAPRHTTGGELSTQDYQQLLQMGFSEEMIGSTQARLLASGQTLTVENMLALLVP